MSELNESSALFPNPFTYTILTLFSVLISLTYYHERALKIKFDVMTKLGESSLILNNLDPALC